MIRYKTTKKDVMKMCGTYPVLKISYCALQNLLRYETSNAYISSKAYGWRADVYELDGIVIVTGYAPFGNFELGYNFIKDYELKAEKLKTKDEIKELLKEFIQAARKKYFEEMRK